MAKKQAVAVQKQYCIHGEENCNRCAMNDVEAPTIHLHLLIDVSTSMISRWSQTISGLNEYIDALRQDPNPYKLTITEFGLENEVVDLYTDADLDQVQKFDHVSFYPHGRGTALWSAVGLTLSKVQTGGPVLFVVITDGEDNSSHQYGSDTVNTLIEERKKLGNYTFAYLGVAKEAWGQEAKVRAFAASSQVMTQDAYGIDTYKGLAACTRSYSATMTSNASLGHAMHVNSLFDPNGGGLPVNGTAVDDDSIGLVHSTTTGGQPAGWQAGH